MTAAGPHEHRYAEWVVTHGNLANGVPCETLLSSVGVNRDFIVREARQSTGDPARRLVLDPKLVVEVHR